MSARWIVAGIVAAPIGVLLGAALTMVSDTKFGGCIGLMVVLAALAAGAVASYVERGERLHAAICNGSAHVAEFSRQVAS